MMLKDVSDINSEDPERFILCLLQLDPLKEGFLSNDRVVIKIPSNSSVSAVNHA